jgi:hypothetical protein
MQWYAQCNGMSNAFPSYNGRKYRVRKKGGNFRILSEQNMYGHQILKVFLAVMAGNGAARTVA